MAHLWGLYHLQVTLFLTPSPEVFFSEILKHLKLKDIKNGYFAKFSNAFTGNDIKKAFVSVEAFVNLKQDINKILGVFIEKGVLIVLKGDEVDFDTGSIYTVAYTEQKDPINSVSYSL